MSALPSILIVVGVTYRCFPDAYVLMPSSIEAWQYLARILLTILVFLFLLIACLIGSTIYIFRKIIDLEKQLSEWKKISNPLMESITAISDTLKVKGHIK